MYWLIAPEPPAEAAQRLPADARDYGTGAQILADLGLLALMLLVVIGGVNTGYALLAARAAAGQRGDCNPVARHDPRRRDQLDDPERLGRGRQLLAVGGA